MDTANAGLSQMEVDLLRSINPEFDEKLISEEEMEREHKTVMKENDLFPGMEDNPAGGAIGAVLAPLLASALPTLIKDVAVPGIKWLGSKLGIGGSGALAQLDPEKLAQWAIEEYGDIGSAPITGNGSIGFYSPIRRGTMRIMKRTGRHLAPGREKGLASRYTDKLLSRALELGEGAAMKNGLIGGGLSESLLIPPLIALSHRFKGIPPEMMAIAMKMAREEKIDPSEVSGGSIFSSIGRRLKNLLQRARVEVKKRAPMITEKVAPLLDKLVDRGVDKLGKMFGAPEDIQQLGRKYAKEAGRKGLSELIGRVGTNPVEAEEQAATGDGVRKMGAGVSKMGAGVRKMGGADQRDQMTKQNMEEQVKHTYDIHRLSSSGQSSRVPTSQLVGGIGASGGLARGAVDKKAIAPRTRGVGLTVREIGGGKIYRLTS